ncbi:hypothetical protein E1091_09035, partial [Micromonospora fluostatini]
MSRLEKRYRLLLRLLPAAYRQEWEDDMVTAFLDSMETGDPDTTEYVAEHGRPGLSEIASILSLAVRLRLGGPDAPPRSFAWGQAVRLSVLMAMLTHAVTVTVSIAVPLWLSGKMAWLPAPTAEWVLAPPRNTWHTVWGLAGYAWLPAYLALVLGHRRVAQAVALLAVVPPAVTTVVQQFAGDVPPSVTPWAMRLVDVLLLLAMSAFHHGAPPVPRRPWLLALPVGILLAVPLFTLQATTPALSVLDWPGLSCATVTAAMLVHLAVRGRGHPARTLPWSLALLLLAVTAFVVRTATLPDHLGQVHRSTLTAIASVEVLVVLAVGVPLAVL